jgi:hypothetical protein
MSDKQARGMDTNELHNETAIKEVQNLIKQGTTQLSPDIINKLRSKYSDDSVVDSIMEYFADRRNKVSKVANIFMDAFQRKYRDNFQSMSLSKFMKRTLRYKKRYNLADDEYDEIRRVFEMRVFNTNPNPANLSVIYPNTNLSRVLGYPITESTDSIKPSNNDDYSYLQDILRNFQMFRSIHSYIVIQTMLYKDLSPEATSGKFDINKHDVNRYVHPVLAALFLPKMVAIEERMLYANIGSIINSRYAKERIITKPDYELFYAMIVDPADTVCDNSSPMKDLLNRYEVQIQLWNNVYNLRNGKYYEATVMDFIAYIDKCRISNVDNPDVLYLSDEGVILRRLFSVFSFRPIIVSTQPVFGIISNNPLNLPVNVSAITTIPYITYKLPQYAVADQTYSLNDAINQIQYYMENGTFVPKSTQIIDTRGPLVFYVPRRFVGLPVNITSPHSFGITQLQNSSRNYHTINNTNIEFDKSIQITTQQGTTANKMYYLRSVVALEKYLGTNMILGHMTILFKYLIDSNTNEILNATPENTTIYIPRRANLLTNKNHFAIVDENNALDTTSIIQNYGTIFVYANNDKL